MRRLIQALAVSALLVGGAASGTIVSKTGEEKLAKLLEGRVAGKPVHCIYLPANRDAQVINGTAIVYGWGKTIYVNRPASGASSLSSGDILLTKTSSTELCNVDIVRILDQGSHFPRGFVNLGDFVPYTKVRTGSAR